jgi:hypothetical protein
MSRRTRPNVVRGRGRRLDLPGSDPHVDETGRYAVLVGQAVAFRGASGLVNALLLGS